MRLKHHLQASTCSPGSPQGLSQWQPPPPAPPAPPLSWSLCFPGGSDVKCLSAILETMCDPWVRKILWRRKWQRTPVLLPGKSHGQRSLVGYSPWGREESDTTERLHFQYSLSCIGEGNGNPLQYSCLENSRDGGAWWAAVYGIPQSWTRLKRLSSSSFLFCKACGGRGRIYFIEIYSHYLAQGLLHNWGPNKYLWHYWEMVRPKIPS